MRYERQDDTGEALSREELKARYGLVYDVRAFARSFVLLGISGPRVIVRGKLGEDAVGTLRYLHFPLLFFDYRPLSEERQRPFTPRRSRP